ncbi:MAG: sporulation protein YunB [Oscillospiraceae bacterium]
MPGFFRYRRQLSRRQRVLLALFALAGTLLAVFCIATLQLRPILTKMATARVSNTVTGVVTEAVNATIDSGAVDYHDLICFEKDNEGKVTAVKSDMAEFNRLQAHILNRVLEKLSAVSSRDLSIPVGSLTGAALLSGRGPRITVKMQSVGSSTASLENVFTSAGINQTRHQIILHVDVFVNILLPGFITATKVSNAFTVAETVIVGSVPQTYTYFSSDAPIREDAKEFILNGT